MTSGINQFFRSKLKFVLCQKRRLAEGCENGFMMIFISPTMVVNFICAGRQGVIDAYVFSIFYDTNAMSTERKK